MNLPYIIY